MGRSICESTISGNSMTPIEANQTLPFLLRPNGNPGWGIRRPFLWFALIFGFAFLYRLVAISQLSSPPVHDLLWNDAVAWNLAQGNGFTASQSEPFVPGVLRTPGYPAFLAVVYYLFGHSYAAAFVFQALVDSLSAMLITLIGLRLMSPRVALTAGILYGAYPYSAFFCGVLSQDILLTLAVLVVLYLTARVELVRPRLWQWLLVGLAIGVAALVKSFMILLVLVPVLLALLAVSGVRRKIAALAMVVIGAAVMVSPWVVRNYVVFRSFPPLAVGGTGSNLRLILIELEGGEEALIKQLAPPRFDSAVSSQYLDEFVDGSELIARERELFRQSYPEIVRQWPRYLLVSIGHIPRLWLTRHTIGHGRMTATIAFVVSLLYVIPGIAGMFLARARWRQLLPALGGIIVVTLIYAPYTAEARYTLPVRPVLMLFIATAIHFVVTRLRTLGRNRNLVPSMANERALASGSRDGAEGRIERLRILWFTVIFLLAVVVRLAVISQTAMPPANDLLWNDAVAWNLVQGNGFTASQSEPYVPGVFRTPGYPAFLAVVYYFFGHSHNAAFVFQALLDALSAVLITLVGLRLMSARVALTAGFLYAMYPYSAFFCGVLSQDTLLTFSVLIVLYLTARADLARPVKSEWFVVGLAIGVAALVKSFIILVAAVPALLVLLSVSGMRRKIATLAMLGMGAAVVISPWVVRNYLLFHSFPPLAVGGTGTDFVLTLKELEGGEEALINDIVPPRFDPAISSQYLDGFVDGTELIARENDLFRQSYPEILKRWPRYLAVSIGHIPRLWLTQHTVGHGPFFAMLAVVLSWLYLIPGVLGMIMLRTEWRRLVLLFGSIFVITLIYAPHLVEARYTLPVRPVLMLFVATTLYAVAVRWRAIANWKAGRAQADLETAAVFEPSHP